MSWDLKPSLQRPWSLEDGDKLVQAILLCRKQEVYSYDDLHQQEEDFRKKLFIGLSTELMKVLNIVINQKIVKEPMRIFLRQDIAEPSWLIRKGALPIAVYQNVEGI